MREMDAATLSEYLERCDTPPLLLDVRQPWEFDVCRIEGSQLIPMGQLPRKLAELDPEQETVVICHHGIRSRIVAAYLLQQGLTRVVNLRGGLNAWSLRVDPGLPRY